jgi:hypothetical protein
LEQQLEQLFKMPSNLRTRQQRFRGPKRHLQSHKSVCQAALSRCGLLQRCLRAIRAKKAKVVPLRYKGVTRCPSGRFSAAYRFPNRECKADRYFGTFATQEQAAQAIAAELQRGAIKRSEHVSASPPRGGGGAPRLSKAEPVVRVGCQALLSNCWNSFSKCQVTFAHANIDHAGLSGTCSPIRACAKQLCLAAVCFSVAFASHSGEEGKSCPITTQTT